MFTPNHHLHHPLHVQVQPLQIQDPSLLSPMDINDNASPGVGAYISPGGAAYMQIASPGGAAYMQNACPGGGAYAQCASPGGAAYAQNAGPGGAAYVQNAGPGGAACMPNGSFGKGGNVADHASLTKRLQDELAKLGHTIKAHEENLMFLKKETDNVDESIVDLQATLGKQRCEIEGTTGNDTSTHVQTVENTVQQILQQEKSAAGVICQLRTHGATQAPNLPLTKDVLGIVATLGHVDDDDLSRLFSEFLGLEKMMAFVCMTYEGVESIELYKKEGKISKGTGLHGIGASIANPVDGRFEVICLEGLRPYVGDKVSDDPQRKLSLMKPRLPNGECPPGFLGFAVNMINLDYPYLSYLTASGHGLRETLFYSLFSRVQVYKTRAEMLLALPFICDGALSLDGGMIRSAGMLVLGDRKDVHVRFPLTSPMMKMPLNYMDTEEKLKLKQWEKERILEDAQREQQLLVHVKQSFESKRQEFVKRLAESSSYVTQVKIMSGKENDARRPTPERGGQPRGKGTRYVIAQRNTSCPDPLRSFNPRRSHPEHSSTGKRPATEKDSAPLKPPPRSYMQPRDSWRNVNLEDLKVRHCLQDFEVRFYGDGDDLTFDMIKNYRYDSSHLLTTVGQLEAGLRLPLYRYDDTFCYDVLASRDKFGGSARRSVVQYSGNWHRILDECRLRERGQSRLTCYTPDPNQQTCYTPANFNATYKDYCSHSNRKRWSVGPARRKLSSDQYKAGMHFLLEEVDNIKIKVVPGTEDLEKPVTFPKDQKLRDDHDFRWHRTPIEIVGPWAWGWSLNNPSQFRRSGPKRYGTYCPWLLNFDKFNFDYTKEDQYDFSEEARISKKCKVSRKSTNVELVDEDIPEVLTPHDPEDEDDDDDEEYEYDSGFPMGMVETVDDNTPPEISSNSLLKSGHATLEKVIEEVDSDRKPSPDVAGVKDGQVLIGGKAGGPFTLEHDEHPGSFSVGREVEEVSPLIVDLLKVSIPGSPWFDDVELVDISSTAEKYPEVVGGTNPKALDGKGPTVVDCTGPGLLPPPSIASSSGNDGNVVDGLADINMSNDEAIYQWASMRGLLDVPASSPVDKKDVSSNAEICGKMRVESYDNVRDAFLNPDHIHASLRMTHAPTASVAEMRSFVDGQAYFLPQFSLAMLAQSQQYCYELYQLEKLKAVKYEDLYRFVDAELVAKKEELCNFQQQLIEERKTSERTSKLEQEDVNLRNDMAKLKADLDESTCRAKEAIDKLKATVTELEAAKTEIVSFQGKLTYSAGLVSSTEQRVIIAENEVAKLRAQVASDATTHAANVAKVKNEGREHLIARMGVFLAKVNKETGKNYRLKF